MCIITFGIDLAKRVFVADGVDEAGTAIDLADDPEFIHLAISDYGRQNAEDTGIANLSECQTGKSLLTVECAVVVYP